MSQKSHYTLAEDIFEEVIERIDIDTLKMALEDKDRLNALLDQFCDHDQPKLRLDVIEQIEEFTRESEVDPLESAFAIFRATLPDQIGKYEPVGILGSGGYCIVYRAYDPSTKRWVAVKTLNSPILDPCLSRIARARFNREVKILKRLKHRCIVKVLKSGRDSKSGFPFLVQEYLEGEDLRDIIGNPELTWGWALFCLSEIAQALDYAHKKGVSHRDLKPENIRILNRRPSYEPLPGERPLLKILDFGISKLERATPLTRSGHQLGTAGYMAPEQLCGGRVDSRADIFSFGIVAHELLSTRSPFSGSTAGELYQNILHSNPKPLRCGPSEIQIIIRRCLRKRRKNRFQYCGEIANGIEALRRKAVEQGWADVRLYAHHAHDRCRQETETESAPDGLLHFPHSDTRPTQRRGSPRTSLLEESILLEERLADPGPEMEFPIQRSIEFLEHAREISMPALSYARRWVRTVKCKREGRALYAQRDFLDAAVAFEESIELNPQDFGSYVRLARSLAKLRKHDEAIEVRRRACEALPYYFSSYISLARALERHGRHDEGVEVRRQACETRPKDSRTYVSLARALERLGRVDEAVEVRRIAHEALPNGSGMLRSLMRLLERLGRDTEAADLRRCV